MSKQALNFDFGDGGDLAAAFGGASTDGGAATTLEEVQSNPEPDIQVINGDAASFQQFLANPTKTDAPPTTQTQVADPNAEPNNPPIQVTQKQIDDAMSAEEAEQALFDQMLVETGIIKAPEPKKVEGEAGDAGTTETPKSTFVKNDDPSKGEGAEFFQNFAKDLVASNVLGEIPEEELSTISDYKDILALQEKEIVAETDNRIKRLMRDLDPDAASFLKFKADGGKTEDYFRVLQRESGKPIGDITNEAVQEEWVKYYLTTHRNSSSAEAALWVETAKSKGQLEAWASKFQTDSNRIDQDAKADTLRQAEEAKRLKAEEAREYAKTVGSVLSKTEINGIAMNKRYSDKLHDIIFGVDKKTGASVLHTELGKALSNKNEDKLVVLAAVIESGFDISKLIPKLQKSATKKVKKELESSRKVPNVRSSGEQRDTNLALADYF